VEKGVLYLIKNKLTGGMYVGQTVDLKRRLGQHYRNEESVVGKAIQKYGKDNFETIILKDCKVDELDKWEIYYIDKYNTFKSNKHYNANAGRWTNVGESNPMYNKQHSEKTKKLIGKKAKIRYKNPSNNPMYGRKHSEETKKKISDAKKGQTYGEEFKKMRREYMKDKFKGLDNPNAKVTNELAKKVIRLREFEDMTYKEIGEHVDLSRSVISLICRGEHYTTRDGQLEVLKKEVGN
jgi:group I intron endonuclease